ncbi:hypothetical protein D3C81_1587890 [compost metagenome]
MLSVCRHSFEYVLLKVDENSFVGSAPRAYVMHIGHSLCIEGEQSGVLSVNLELVILVLNNLSVSPFTQSSTISAPRFAAFDETKAGNGTYKLSHPCPAKTGFSGSSVDFISPRFSYSAIHL